MRGVTYLCFMDNTQTPALPRPPLQSEAGAVFYFSYINDQLTEVLSDEKTERKHHAEKMALLATRRTKLEAALEVLQEIPASTDAPPHDLPALPANAAIDEAAPAASNTVAPGEPIVGPRPSSRSSLKKAILAILEQHDTFLTSEDIKNFLSQEHPSEKYAPKRVVDALKDARQPGFGVVGYTAYSGFVLKYLHGLPSFYEDADQQVLKPEYADKLAWRLIELRLDSDKPEPIKPHSTVSEGGLFPSSQGGDLQKQTAPALAEAE